MVHGRQSADCSVVAVMRIGLVIAVLAASPPVLAQQSPRGDGLDTPLTRMRPIGAPSAVDRYPAAASKPRPSGFSAPRRPSYSAAFPLQQTALMQGTSDAAPLAAPSLPPAGGFGMPGGPAAGTPPSFSQPPAGRAVPGSIGPSPLPSSRAIGNGGLQPVPLTRGQAGPGDLTPLPQPELNNQFATVDNCACVSAPSSYTAGGIWGCDPPPAAVIYPSASTYPAVPIYAPPPAVVVPPTVMPTTLAGTAAPCRPLITLGQGAYNAQLGQGIIGQPTAYVPGQTFRNFIRYLSP